MQTQKAYVIETKADKVCVVAKNRDYAFAKYFKDIAEQKISLEKIGNIVILHDGKEKYPFRVVPLLWKMGIIDDETAIANIVQVVGGSRNEARKMLEKCADADGRLIPFIDELALREVKT